MLPRLIHAWPLALLLALVLSGCSSLLYVPESHVAPMFAGGGAVSASASVETGEYGGQVAVAPVKHVFAFATASVASSDGSDERAGGLGAGVWLDLSRVVKLEALVGAGRGERSGSVVLYLGEDPVTGAHQYESVAFDASSRRRFAQVNIGARNHDGLTVTGAFRLAHVAHEGTSRRPDRIVFPTTAFFEPAFIVRAPVFAFVEAEAQIGASYPLGRGAWNGLFGRREQYGGIGLRVMLGR
jgi:hypothetical protein